MAKITKLYGLDEAFEVALKEYTSEETRGSYDTDGLEIHDFSTETFNMNSYIPGNKVSEHYYIFGYTNKMSGQLFSGFYSTSERIFNCCNFDGKLFIAFVTAKHYHISDTEYGWKAEIIKLVHYGYKQVFQGRHCFPVFAGDHIEFYKSYQTYITEVTDIFEPGYNPEFDIKPRYSKRFIWNKPVVEKIHEDVTIEF